MRKAVEHADRQRDQLDALVGAIVAYFDEQPHLFDLIQRSEVQARPSGVFPWQKTRDAMHDLVLGIFERGEARGAFSIRDPELATLMLLGGLRSVIRFGTQPRPRDLARRVVTTFLAGADVARGSVHAPACQAGLLTEPLPL
jgi:hypothetical protein